MFNFLKQTATLGVEYCAHFHQCYCNREGNMICISDADNFLKSVLSIVHIFTNVIVIEKGTINIVHNFPKIYVKGKGIELLFINNR